MVVLGTPAAVKVTGVIPWIHHTRVKKTVASCDEDTRKTVWDPKIPSKSGSENNSPHPQKTLSPALVTPEVTPEVHAQQKLEDLAIKLSVDFHCQPWDSIPDWYYCYALCYRTSFSHTP